MIEHQIHAKFKVFISEAGIPYAAVRRLDAMVRAFTKEGKHAVKSVGVEYLEKDKRLVLSLGYRDDVPGYSVKLTSVSLGRLQLQPEAIEQAMTKAAGDVENVICHEFFVTDDGEFVMVLLSHG